MSKIYCIWTLEAFRNDFVDIVLNNFSTNCVSNFLQLHPESINVRFLNGSCRPLEYIPFEPMLIKEKKYNICKQLLQHGADPNIDFYTILNISKIEPKIFDLMLKYNFNISKYKNNKIFKILEIYIKKEYFSCDGLKTFLSKSHGILYVNDYGETILHHILQNPRIKRTQDIAPIRMLLDYIEERKCKNYINVKDMRGNTVIHHLIKYDNHVLKLFIKHKADVNLENKRGETLLYLHERKAYINFNRVKLLIKNKADPNYNPLNRAPLLCRYMKSCEHSTDLKKMEFLLKHNADPNKNTPSETPLNIVSNHKNIDAMKMLLKYKADPNIIDMDGNTLLISYLHNDVNVEKIKVLLEHGADPNISEKSALELAYKNDRLDCFGLLLECGADVNVMKDNKLENIIFENTIFRHTNKVIDEINTYANTSTTISSLIATCIYGSFVKFRI